MSTSADSVYCKWCGTPVTGGGWYCPACGRPVERPEVISRATYRAPAVSQDADTEESQGLFGQLASAVGIVVAVPLAILSSLIGAVLPILVVVALFIGPSDTWNMVRGWIPGSGGESAACAGFDDWYDASTDRSERVVGLLEDGEAGDTPNPAALRSLAAQVDALAAEQRRSNPPQQAIALNGMMVDTLVLGADALRAIASGDQSGLQYFVDESDRLTPRFDAEEDRVFDACR